MKQPIVICDDPGLSSEAQKLLQDIRADIAALVQERERMATDEGEVESAPPAKMTEKHLKLARGLPLRRLDLMRRELAIRQRIADEFFPIRQKDRWAYYDKLQKEHDRLSQEVSNKLISIGYVDGILPGGQVYSIDSAMLERHPAIHALGGEIFAAHSRCNANDDERRNREAIEELLRTMQDAKQRALTTAA